MLVRPGNRHMQTLYYQNDNTVGSPSITRYDPQGLKGKLQTMKRVVIPPFVTIMIRGAAKLMTHSKCMNVTVKPIVGYSDHAARSQGTLRIGVGKVDVCLQNYTTKHINFPKQTTVGEIGDKNAILENDLVVIKVTTEQNQMKGQRELLTKLI